MQLSWKQTLLILAGIVVLAAGLRMHNLGNNAFAADEFPVVGSAYAYFETGEWNVWDFNTNMAENADTAVGGSQIPMYEWQVAQAFRFSNPTEATARSVSVLWGIVSVGAIFLAAYMFSRKRIIGLIAAFLFAVSISGIVLDRYVGIYAMFTPVFLLFSVTVFRLYDYEYRGKISFFQAVWKYFGLNGMYVVPALVLGYGSFLLSQSSFFIIPVFGVYALWRLVVEQRQTTSLGNKYGLTVGLFAFATIIGLLFHLKAIVVAIGTLSFFAHYSSYLTVVSRDFWHPLFWVLFSLFGVRFLTKRMALGREAVWLSASFLTPLLFVMFLHKGNAGAPYIFFIQPFLLILVSVGAYAFALLSVAYFNERKKERVFFWAIAFVILLVPNYGYFVWENNTYHETSSGNVVNYRRVFGEFLLHRQPGDALVTRAFRNYYFTGVNAPVLDFGGMRTDHKLRLDEVQSFVLVHLHGWVMFTDNDTDFVSSEAMDFIRKTMDRVNSPSIRGTAEVYRW